MTWSVREVFAFARSIVPVMLLGAAVVLPPAALAGEAPFIEPGATGTVIRDQVADTEIRAMLRAISPTRLEQTVNSLVGFGTRHTLSSQTDPLRGIGAATQFVFSQLQAIAATSSGHMVVQQQSFVQPPGPRIPVPTVITNVVATLTGSASPDRIHVVVANLDSRVTDVLDFTSDAPGADSNATGVALVIELARVFATHRPKATIVFSVVGGAEQGLFGSAFQAAQYKAAGADIAAAFSVDRVGASVAEDGTRDPRTVRLFTEGVPTAETAQQAAIRQAAGGEVDSVSRELGRFVRSVAENGDTGGMRVRHIYRRDRMLRASDQVSFLTQGYAGARFTEAHDTPAHENENVQVVNGVQFGDLVEFLDFDYVARVAKVVGLTLWSLAQGPGAPKNVHIDVATATNDTNLTWSANTELDLAGYEVLWRETTDPDWTHVIPVGNVTSAQLPDFSRDNVFFGVRAVDTRGHHSPASFPTPF